MNAFNAGSYIVCKYVRLRIRYIVTQVHHNMYVVPRYIIPSTTCYAFLTNFTSNFLSIPNTNTKLHKDISIHCKVRNSVCLLYQQHSSQNHIDRYLTESIPMQQQQQVLELGLLGDLKVAYVKLLGFLFQSQIYNPPALS